MAAEDGNTLVESRGGGAPPGEQAVPGKGELELSLINGTVEDGKSRDREPVKQEGKAQHSLDSSFWLAACSVLGGCSCIGIYAVVNAVRASEMRKQGDTSAERRFRKRAIKFSVLSFVVCVLSVLLGLGLIVLLSYIIRVAT